MERGWSITRTEAGTALRSLADADDGDTITTHVADGTVTSTIISTAPHEGQQ
jgi:exodeoxyribonuclease VII large subunit